MAKISCLIFLVSGCFLLHSSLAVPCREYKDAEREYWDAYLQDNDDFDDDDDEWDTADDLNEAKSQSPTSSE